MVLPINIWQIIFSNLHLPDLRICTLVSNTWKEAIEDSYLWYQLYQRDFNLLVGGLSFNQGTPYKNFYESLYLSYRQKLLAPLIKQAEGHLTKACAAGTTQKEISLGYENAIKNLETAFKIQTKQKGNTAGLLAVIADLKQQLTIPRILQEALLYLPSEKEIKELNEVLDLYQDQGDPFSCWAEYIDTFKEEGLLPHLHYLEAALCEYQKKPLQAMKAYLSLSENNPLSIACIEKAYALFEAIKDLDVVHGLQKDGIRMAFEKYLASFDQQSSQQQAPTCFICFNFEEKDVGKWLEETLVPDLDKAGIKPIFCFRELSQGQDLDNFQELARSADQVIIACTPELKEKYEERKKAPVGLAQEIRMIKSRYNDPDKANTIFPIFLKGTRKEALPTAYFEPIFGTKMAPFSDKAISLEFNYFSNAFDLFTALRGISREQSRQARERFFEGIKGALRGSFDREAIEQWRAGRKKKLEAVRHSTAERVSAYTQMMNLPLPPQDFTGREQELKTLHEKCSHQHRVAVIGLGGIGKTALALKYANDYKSHYQFIHFMLAGSVQLIIDGLLKLADDLHVPKLDNVEDRLSCLKTTLEKFEKEYLVIFDGIDQVEIFQEIEKYLPDRGRCLLLTSRMPEQAKAQKFEVMELHLFPPKEAIEYLLKATGLKENKEAQELVELLGRLPLALKHAAGYIRSQKIKIQDYIQEFKHYQVKLFEEGVIKSFR